MVEDAAPVQTQTSPPDGSDSGVRLSVIIPSYNEFERLPAFLTSVLAYLRGRADSFEVIVVDDGSTDETGHVALDAAKNAPEIRLVTHLQNTGKGAAVRTGMQHASGDLCLFADADGATQMDELPALEDAIKSGANIAVGSREGRDKQVDCSPLRRFLGRWFNRAVRMGAVKRILDTQCGFKLFNRPEGTGLFDLAQEDGFAFDVELLFLAQRQGSNIKEVFVNWTEQPGSKVSLLKDGIRMLKAVRRIKKRFNQGFYKTAKPRITPARETQRSGSA